MDKSLAIIRHTRNDFIAKNIEKNGFKVIQAYKDTNYLLYLIWKLFKKFNLPGQSHWYNHESKNIGVETIILIESNLTLDFVKWIRKNNPNSRVVFWYWNIAQNTIDPNLIRDKSIEKWSFSEKDCKRYGLIFNPPFYFNNIQLNQAKDEYDLYFAGKNKGRLPMLLDFKRRTEKMGLKTHLHISPTKKIDLLFNRKDLKPAISYNQVLGGVAKSRALLDIIEVTDSGQSQRTMESIFFEKKLITNSKFIKNYDFYRPENIFVIGEDEMEKLPDFIRSPYLKIDDSVVKQYEINSWVERFLSK